MSKINFNNIAILLFLTFTLASCKKNDVEIDENKMGDFSVEFQNIMGGETFKLDWEYKNAKNEPFKVSTLNYFISNIKLKNANGETYVVPAEESYFLVKADDLSSRFTNVKVPEGDYTELSFILGVDSLRNTMNVEDRKGVLSFDPDAGHSGGGMYWGWNSGYIFFKYEGTCQLISDDQNGDPTGKKQFKYHIGGFGGYSSPTINNIKEITLNLSNAGNAQVREGFRSNAHLFVDISKVFNGPNVISIVEHPNVMFSEFSQNIANNFPSMFSHDHTENFVKSSEELD
ncbi:MbnP family protein [Sphingobacterium hungaricum]|uniref:Copper-binding protein MbnP-like domain-containing protein n=1 Tax=Sphingobacterium hungaricum TaxID=2082723 RepID=A0A928YQA8_9SPHI|nr:MbnP family protein [Sphingobacterium hungaricum]MBE8714011.1 hypothetical protein [Sphingobacterium hungaricum]